MKSTKNSLMKLFAILMFVMTHQLGYTQLYGESLDFPTNGSSYVQLSGDNDFGKVTNFQNEFTFEAWVLSEGSKTWSRVFDFGDSTNDFIIFTTKSDNGECEFSYRTGGSFRPLVKGGIFPTGWTHVACTLDAGGQATIYLNGEIAGTADWNKSINDIYGTTKSYLGKSQYAQDPYFEGKMDEVRVWKEARTQTEIQDWMNCELTGNNENLIGYFKMNQGLSTGPSTSDNFINNFGKLSKHSGILYNFSLAGNNGNWVNETPMASTTESRNCIEFDDADGVKIISESNFDYTEAHTFEAWINPNKNDGGRIITIKANDALTDYPFYMDYNGSTLFWGQRSSSFHNWAVAYNALELGKWQHVAGVTYEVNGGVTNEIYVNGVLKGQAFHPNQQLTQNNAQVTLGWVAQNFRFNGKMSNVRYWNVKKEQFDLAQNMSTHYPVGTEGLVAQFNTYSNADASFVDHINNNLALNIRTPDFSNDPCFVHFKQQPEDQEISIAGGETITFTAEVEECITTSLFSFQWQKDGSNIEGATDQTYIINNVSNSDQGVYTLNVTACNGQVFTTRKAKLTSANMGTVLSFDGKDDYMEFDAVSFTPENAYTIETWVRFRSEPKNQSIIVLTNDEGPEEYYTSHIRVNPEGYIEHSTYDQSNTKTVRHPEKIESNRWYHIKATAVNANIMSISVDGVMSSETLAIGVISSGTKYMVGHPACGHDIFEGDMADLRIWKTDTNTYSATPTDLMPGDANFSNLLHYYDFNKGVANADNSTLTSNVNDPYFVGGNLAQLYNFSFNYDESNWTACGPEIVSELGSSLYDISKFIGENAFLDVNPVGLTGEESFQWYKDDVAINGATSSQLNLDNLLPYDNGTYHIMMERPNSCPARSNSSNLLVYGSGEVLNFDGVDDYVTIDVDDYADDPDLLDYRRTISLWVKLEGDVGLQNILQATDASGPMSTVTNQIYTDADGYLSFFGSPTGTLDGIQFKSDFQFQANS